MIGSLKQKRLRSATLLAATCCCVLTGLASQASAARVHDVDASYIYTSAVYIPAGPATVYTLNLSPGADTVLYLWRAGGATEGQVAWNDDSAGTLASRVDFTSTGRTYYIVLRAYSNGSHGSCDVVVNGSYHARAVPIGGHVMRVNNVAAGDTVQTALLNQGASDTTLFGFDYSGNLRSWDDDSGVGLASKFRAPVNLNTIAVGTWSTHSLSGPVRVYLNDLSSGDYDGDNLGPGLETELCTCDGWFTVSCGRTCYGTRNYQDSDADGIRDDYEAFGRERLQSYPDFPQHLVAYGADPARKDLFVEVDWLCEISESTKECVPLQSPMTAVEAAKVVQAYNAPGTAAFVANRDGTDGIAVHLDIGTASTGTGYGNWGGAGPTPNTEPTKPSPRDFAPSRRGIFHYALNDGYGRAGRGWALETTGDGATLAHELGHNLSLHHGGSVSAVRMNGKPNYRSLMNYATGGLQFSKGEFAAAPLDLTALCEAEGLKTTDRSRVAYLENPPFSYTIEQYNVGSPYWGIDWNRDGIISPCSVKVEAAVAHLSYSQLEQEMGRYYWQKFNDSVQVHDTSTPALSRAFGRLYLVYRKPNGAIVLRHTTNDFRSGCPADLFSEAGCASWTAETVLDSSSDPGGPDAAAVAAYGVERLVVVYKKGGNLHSKTLLSNGSVLHSGVIPGTLGVAHEPVLEWHDGELLLLYRIGAINKPGPVYGTRYWPGPIRFNAPTSDKWRAVRRQTFNGSVISLLAVYGLAAHPGGLRGLFSDTTSLEKFAWADYQGDGDWSWITGSKIEGTSTHTNSLASWTNPKRAGFAYRPYSSGSGLPGGRWYLYYNLKNNQSHGIGAVYFAMTQGDGDNAPLVWLPRTQFDNQYENTGAGVEILGWHPGGGESNLRYTIGKSQGAGVPALLRFRPYADGIFPTVLKDVNDWLVMEHALCASLHGCTASICTATGENQCLGDL